MKQTIRIKFVDFYKEFNYKTNIIYNIILKHYNVEIVDNPDYLIYSVFGTEHYNYDCIKIFYSGENLAPDFNFCDYAVAFEYIEFGDRYCRCPLYFSTHYDEPRNMMLRKHLDVSDQDYNREFCSFVYSNNHADEIRDQLFYALSLYNKVDSGGKHMNNVGGPVESKIEFESKHRFSIACENSSHLGYSTEKLVEAFAARTVPIYWGDPGIKRIFNEKAFIYVGDFLSLDMLVDYVKKINENPQMYLRMLRQPALLDEKYISNTLNKMEIFLTNIFDQEYAKAFRRNRVFWGENYINLHREMKMAYDDTVGYLIKKTVKKIKKKVKL